MKTNVNMIRILQNFEVVQRTKDGYFNFTYLVKQWNNVKSNKKKEIKEFFKLKGTKEFLQVLDNELNTNRCDSTYLNNSKSEIKSYYTTKGNKGATWVHPYLFIKAAMWLSPKFEFYVIQFIYDRLIEFRLQSGDLFKEMNIALKERSIKEKGIVPPPIKYIQEAKRIKKVLNVISWNTATELQLKYRNKIEQANILCFQTGLYKHQRENMINSLVEKYKMELLKSI